MANTSIEQELNRVMAEIVAALHSIMTQEVCDEAKDAIARSAEENVYNAYAPEFYSRRMENGGLLDKDNMVANYSKATFTLVIEDETPWQQLYGGTPPKESLADMIEAGSERFNFGTAGARIYYQKAEDDIKNRLEGIITKGLAKRGIQASLR